MSLTVFVVEVDKDITVIQSNLRKVKLFLPILYISKEKKKYLLNVVWSKYYKFEISQINELSVQKSGGDDNIDHPPLPKKWGVYIPPIPP